MVLIFHHHIRFFIKKAHYEILSTVRIYRDILRHPTLLAHGTYQVLRDIFYELPRSFIYKKIHKDLETHLDESASQALTISELMTIPGNYIGFFIGKFFVNNVYLASIIGANVGDYFSGVISYAVAYMILTRGHGSAYSPRKALVDNLEVIKDCLPASFVLYVSEAPLIAGLIALGFSAGFAIAVNLVIAVIIFMGVAKYSATKQIEKRFN
ncbi:hypothetical protein KA057_01685 [Candidatus Gracilibacteria bacterium]|nr:hypothetical protein [Candidatus Gracilibacteria bacterium]